MVAHRSLQVIMARPVVANFNSGNTPTKIGKSPWFPSLRSVRRARLRFMPDGPGA
jgi:hypothetical protein